jgi:hypothetical protein
VRDLYEEHAKRTGTREQFTYDSVENSLVMWQQRERIDYCWAFDALGEEGIRFLPLVAEEVQVLKQERGSEWSDHWAQVFTLKPKGL